jgi:hypothetical protein
MVSEEKKVMGIFDFKKTIDDLNKKVESISTQKALIYAGIACLVVWFGASAVIKTRSGNDIVPEAQTLTSLDTDKGDTSRTDDEALSLRDIAIKTGIPMDRLLGVFQKKGFKVKGADDTIEQIARDNRTSSDRLLSIIDTYKNNSTAYESRNADRFAGKTLEEICDERNLSLNDVLTRLESTGSKVDSKDKLREIATKLGISSSQLLSMIEDRTQ